MSRNKGKRYSNEPKLNIKKVIAVILAIAVLIMFIVVISKLLRTGDKKGSISVISYYPVYTNEKWGVINSNGNIVIEPTMSEMITVPDSKTDLFICTYDVDYTNNTYKTKVINKDQKQQFTEYEIVEAIENYDKTNSMWYEEKVLKVKKDGKYGLINYKGNEILPVEYTEIEALHGVRNSLIIKKDDQIGLCDNTGRIIIDVQYKDIIGIDEEYKNGYIVINNDNKYGIIDFNKETILETKYEEVKPIIGNDLYVVKENGKQKLIRKDGTTVIEDKFDSISEINDENIIFTKKGKYGIINTNQEEKVKAEYEDLKYIFEDYYIAKKSGKYGIINILNETILPFNYTSLTYRKNANFIEAEKSGSINTQILDTKFEQKMEGIISEVNVDKGYIRIRIGDEYKYYNLKFEEKTAQSILTTNSLFLSKKDGKYGYVDKDQKVIVDYIYDDATEQNLYGFSAIKKDGKWGAINEKGEIVVENKYELKDNLIIDFIGKWHLGEDLNAYYYTDM